MQANKLRTEIKKTLESLSSTGPILMGSVNKVILGKKTRTRGNRVAYLLTYKSEDNKTKSVYIKKSQIQKVKVMIRSYRKLKTDMNRLVKLNLELFKAENTNTKPKIP